MASLLTASHKAQIAAVFDDMHDTFSRDITIYKEGEAVLIGIDDDYNYLYDRRKDSKAQTPALQKYTTKARIKYFGEQEKDGAGKDIGLRMAYGEIRLKIDSAAYDLIRSAAKIEVDGQLYRLRSDAARTGPFSAQYYVVYLQRGD